MKKYVLLCLACAVVTASLLMWLPDAGRNCRAWAKEQALRILVNDAPSQIKPLESKGMQYVPLSFPLEEGKKVYQVTVEYDKAKGTATIHKVEAGKQKTRGDEDCPRCNGTKKCQSCYPAGSGKNINGEAACSICDGTGKCWSCNGTGKK